MTRGSSARRSNALIAAVAVVLAAGAAAAAVFGERTTPSSNGSASSVPVKPQVDGSGVRPAETARSWFDHGTAREQFDYAMKSLSCAVMNTFLTVDLCAVATAKSGSFMLVGSESFWDPSDVDSDGLAWIPFDLTAYTMRRDGDAPRAISVLDGYTEKAHTSRKAQLDLYKVEVNGDDVLVLVKRQSNPDADPYEFTEEVQVLAASHTGAPTLVASYSGSDVEVSCTASSVVLSSLRYPSPSDENGPGAEWYSRITLTPTSREPYSWDERITSGDRPPASDSCMTLVGSHPFPSRKGNGPVAGNDPQSGNA